MKNSLADVKGLAGSCCQDLVRQEESVILQRKGLNGKSVTGDVRRQKQGASMLGIRWDRPAETAINPPGWGQTGVAGGHFSNNGCLCPQIRASEMLIYLVYHGVFALIILLT